MAKQLLFDDRARLKLQRGVETLAKAVAVTMGPTGRNVIIDKSFGNPVVTKDGVTVSKEVELEDPYEHMGAKLVNEVADLWFHCMIALAHYGKTPIDVVDELSRREGLSGLEEKALRKAVAREAESKS